MNILVETLVRGADELGIILTKDQLYKFKTYYQLLVEANKKINLTSIVGEQEIAVKHFVDSLTCLKAFPGENVENLADVGTGAGFPGIPLKICRPEIRVVLIEAQEKKTAFLRYAIKELGLSGIQAVNARAEDAGRDGNHREAYGIAVARALASLNVLAEYCLPLVKIGGYFLAMKGPELEEELERSHKAIAETGGTLERIIKLRLPLTCDQRNLVLIKKVRSSDLRYPRRPGVPKKKPL